MCSLLHSANLEPQYWSWAIKHAVYLKNHLSHRITQTTPYQAYTGVKPNIEKLRVFGCPVVARLPGKHPAKLDIHAVMGIFLGYTATENNIYYQDAVTKKIKIATNIAFDESGYTILKKDRTFLQQLLQLEETFSPPIIDLDISDYDASVHHALRVKHLSPHAQIRCYPATWYLLPNITSQWIIDHTWHQKQSRDHRQGLYRKRPSYLI